MAIQVRAKEMGLYQIIREPGEEFLIDDEKAFSKLWMERVDAEEKPKAKELAKPKPARKSASSTSNAEVI